ncbi:hypothetical protein LT336_00063 [Spiroplasma sp. JKS002671]|uniref:hypothetical protein n=1 Tax=Spiroplasma attinicola TaxID=2904537 RepID=UPI002022A625|nr:hypothetical protein [Spiroplasma sp. JKS002671]MCL8210333.1 hypothetical protein [Spiroplasma sp. JKS002671]
MKKNIRKKENKKLYKNWKLYAATLAIMLIGAGTGLGIYYGTTNHSEVAKIDLNTLNLEKTISGKENMSEEDAFNIFLNKNESFNELKNNVEIETNSFVKPDYTANGSLTINAKTNSKKYIGTITVTITKLEQINLSTLKLNTILTIPVVSQQAAFDLFIKSNANITDLKENIEVMNYVASDYNKLGSLEIQGKTDGKYTGNIMITIPEKKKTNLNMLISNTIIQGKENMTKEDAFNAFLNANSSFLNLSDFVEYSSYKAATYIANGSLTINAKANTGFIGSLIITITKVELIDLNTLELNTTIPGTEDTTDEQFFQIFLDKNKNIFDENLTREQIQLSNFNGIKIGQNGTLTITVKEGINSKYTGSINITLKYLLDEETIIEMITYLSDNKMLNFQIPTGTKQSELMKLLTEDFRAKLSDYYVYADDIESIDVTTPRYEPTQEQLDTKDFVWIPPKHTDQANLGISYLWLGFTVTYKDGTIKTPSQGPVDEDGYHHSNSVLIAWNLDATITMI